MDEPDWNDDIEDIEPVLDAESEYLGALESLDIRRIMSCWSDSDDVCLVFPGINLAMGQLGVRLAMLDVIKNTSKLTPVLKPTRWLRLGDLGWTFLTGTLISTHGDETLTVSVYVTNIYRREPGGWKILHQNVSPSPHQPSYLEQRLN